MRIFWLLLSALLATGCLPEKFTPTEDYTLGVDFDKINELETQINAKSVIQICDITFHNCTIEFDTAGLPMMSNTSLVFQVDYLEEHYNVVVDMCLAHSDMLDIPVDMSEARRFKAACILLQHWVKGTTNRVVVPELGQSIHGTLVPKLKIRMPDGGEVVIATAAHLALIEAVSLSRKATP